MESRISPSTLVTTMRSYLPSLILICVCVSALSAQQTAVINPLPDPAALLRRLDSNQKNVELLRRNYICLVQEEITSLDKNGKEKKKERREYDEWYVAGHAVRRTLSKDGVPLDAEQQRKEAKRVEKQEKEARERSAKQERGEKNDDEVTVGDFLASSRFTNLHRESRDGREILTMDFEPNPEYKPHSRAQNLISRLRGRIWIDEQDLQIARLEAHLAKGMRFGGFLATLKEGSAIVIEQGRVSDGLWMPLFVDGNIGARVLFAGVNQRLVNRFSNYRKFRTTTTIRYGVEEQPR